MYNINLGLWHFGKCQMVALFIYYSLSDTCSQSDIWALWDTCTFRKDIRLNDGKLSWSLDSNFSSTFFSPFITTSIQDFEIGFFRAVSFPNGNSITTLPVEALKKWLTMQNHILFTTSGRELCSLCFVVWWKWKGSEYARLTDPNTSRFPIILSHIWTEVWPKKIRRM